MIINKDIIIKYADAIFDIIKDKPSVENTKNIAETLEILYNEYLKSISKSDEVLNALGEVMFDAQMNRTFNRTIDLDDDRFVDHLSTLMKVCVGNK